jgi:Ni,Fe-hydrogenase I cytochrome b subunit
MFCYLFIYLLFLFIIYLGVAVLEDGFDAELAAALDEVGDVLHLVEDHVAHVHLLDDARREDIEQPAAIHLGW